MIERQCLHCKKIFKVKPYKIKKGEGKYCSRQCHYEHRVKFGLYKKEKHPNWKGMEIKTICQYCRTEFKSYPVWERKFCSRTCANKARGEFDRYSGKNSPKYNRIECICLWCERTFARTPSAIKKGEGKFCGNTCHNEYMRETGDHSGPNNIQWCGGHFPYYGKSWYISREKALQRAKYTSEISSNDGKLNVHHIIPYREFIQKYLSLCITPHIPDVDITTLRIIPYDLIPFLLFDEANSPGNLIVLTVGEHKKYEGMPIGFFESIRNQSPSTLSNVEENFK